MNHKYRILAQFSQLHKGFFKRCLLTLKRQETKPHEKRWREDS